MKPNLNKIIMIDNAATLRGKTYYEWKIMIDACFELEIARLKALKIVPLKEFWELKNLWPQYHLSLDEKFGLGLC